MPCENKLELSLETSSEVAAGPTMLQWVLHPIIMLLKIWEGG